MSRIFLMFVAIVLLGGAALGVEPDEILPDAALEAHARDISTGLRCLVCQNQSIDDSSAPLARDLRLLVRERLQKGDSDDQVMRFIEDRYGEFVLLRPPLSPRTIVLWLAPLLVLLGAIAVATRGLMRRRVVPGTGAPPLTGEEEEKLRTLLAEGKTAADK
jgi:cytochrome c-type biogenesis protein CcmH